MQRHEIPTHLEVEDKLFAGLTPRQLLLLIMGIGLGYSFWQRFHQLLPLPLVALVAALPGLVSLALATVRPDDRALEHWLLAVLRYLSLPKVCVLGRLDEAARDVQEIDLSPEGLVAMEAAWDALREVMQAPPSQATDEWGMDGTEVSRTRERVALAISEGRIGGSQPATRADDRSHAHDRG